MAKTINEVEKNTSASFGYVKKDILMLNDAISDIHDKIQHLSLNHASLLEKLQGIENEVVKAGKKEAKLEKKVKKANSKNKVKTPIKKISVKRKPSKVIKTEEIVY